MNIKQQTTHSHHTTYLVLSVAEHLLVSARHLLVGLFQLDGVDAHAVQLVREVGVEPEGVARVDVFALGILQQHARADLSAGKGLQREAQLLRLDACLLAEAKRA